MSPPNQMWLLNSKIGASQKVQVPPKNTTEAKRRGKRRLSSYRLKPTCSQRQKDGQDKSREWRGASICRVLAQDCCCMHNSRWPCALLSCSHVNEPRCGRWRPEQEAAETLRRVKIRNGMPRAARADLEGLRGPAKSANTLALLILTA